MTSWSVALRASLSLFLASLLLASPALRAEDDDMPDGDVDIVEKPKNRAEKKKEPEKKDEKKDDKKPEKKDEQKPEKPGKRDSKHRDGKAHDDRPRADDDGDILTVPADDVPARPDKTGKGEKTKPAPVRADDLSVDEDESDEPSNGRMRVLDSVPAPAGTNESIDDDLPAARGGSRPPAAHDDGSEGSGDEADDEVDHEGAESAGRHEDLDGLRAVETRGEEPEGSDDPGLPWVIGGATVGGILLLAGAGVGGYFLVDALLPKTGSLTVTPR